MKRQTKKRMISIALVGITMMLLSSCASNSVGTPCADFGAYCTKTPVNGWDTNGYN